MDKELLRLEANVAALQIGHDQMEMAIKSNYDFRMMGDDIDEKQQLKLFKKLLDDAEEQLTCYKAKELLIDCEAKELSADVEVAYIQPQDITLIIQQPALDEDGPLRIVNFYYGEPNDDDTLFYIKQYIKDGKKFVQCKDR